MKDTYYDSSARETSTCGTTEAPPVLLDLVYFEQIIRVILSSITRTTGSTSRETTIP